MARRTPRTPRRPAAPPPVARPLPRRPTGGVQGAAGAPGIPQRTELDLAAESAHVKRDLRRIAVIAVGLFALIFASPYLIK
jgi:hypothetical protein